MIYDLLAFLHECLDEDEQTARALNGAAIEATESLWGAKYLTVHAAIVTSTSAELPAELADHTARHDPARVLAEVDAKRRILARYEAGEELLKTWTAADEPFSALTVQNAENCGVELALRLLALPYAGHSGYKPEWAPAE